jgi:hypothetical protein
MSESELVWKFLIRKYPNQHPFIGYYINGNAVAKLDSIRLMLISVKDVFYPAFNEPNLLVVIKAYLELKSKEYQRNEFKINTLY